MSSSAPERRDITASIRQTTADPWTVVGVQTLTNLSRTVYVGLAVTSHQHGVLARAQFSTFQLLPAPGQSSLPVDWESTDVGSVAAPGGAAGSDTAFVVHGSGADIWETEDAFHFAYRRLAGDAMLSARMVDLVGPHEWSKMGLMIRSSLAPDAAHHFLLLAERPYTAYQRRPTAGSITEHSNVPAILPTGPPFSPPPLVWYRIERIGGTVRLFEAFLGFAVTSHADGLTAQGYFDNVTFTGNTPPPAWTSQAIGDMPFAGSHGVNSNGVHTMNARGADVWGTTDAFQYGYLLRRVLRGRFNPASTAPFAASRHRVAR